MQRSRTDGFGSPAADHRSHADAVEPLSGGPKTIRKSMQETGMTSKNDAAVFRLDLDREEAWVVHHVVLDYVQWSDRVLSSLPEWAAQSLLKIEAGEYAFEADELEHIRQLCRSHARTDGLPEPERDTTRRVLDRIHNSLDRGRK